MSTNDYTFTLLTEQRRQELAAERDRDRLAHLATAGRTSWWRRLRSARRPTPARTLTAQHRVAS